MQFLRAMLLQERTFRRHLCRLKKNKCRHNERRIKSDEQSKETDVMECISGIIIVVIFLGINGVMTGGLSVSFFRSFISTNAGAICVAIGVTATILVAGTDISLGSIVSLVNVVIVTAFEKGFSVPQAALLGLLTAVLCGMFNGFVVGIMRVNPLLATFATSIAFAGIALWILPYPGGYIDFTFGDWYLGNMFGIIPTPVVLIAILVLIWYL